MKSFTIEDEFVITVISQQKNLSSSRFCDITLENNVELVHIVTKNKSGGQENRIDLSLSGINLLTSLLK